MDTIYTNAQHTIKIKHKDTINLWLWGDVHRDTDSCDVDRWKWFLKKSAQDDPEKTYYMGLGDYNDFASSSEQKALTKGVMHETTMEKFDQIVERDNRKFAAEIKQMRGKLLGLVEGNHSWKFLNGTTSTEDLANRMGCDYLGWLSHVTLTFDFGIHRNHTVGGKRSQNVYIVACHGKAGGKTHGNSINQVGWMKEIFPIADIYVQGHDHQRGAWPCNILYPAPGGKMKQKRQYLCRSGSFKRAYQKDKSQYEVGRLYRPSDLGALKMTIGFHRDREDGDRIITDIEAVV